MEKNSFDALKESVMYTTAMMQKSQKQISDALRNPDMENIQKAVDSKKEKERQERQQEIEEQCTKEHKFQWKLSAIGWFIMLVTSIVGGVIGYALASLSK